MEKIPRMDGWLVGIFLNLYDIMGFDLLEMEKETDVMGYNSTVINENHHLYSLKF